MKKYIKGILAVMMSMSLAACQNANKKDSTTITALNGNKESVEIQVPYDPERIAILDLASLDIIDSLGLGDRVVGSASTTIDYLSDYADATNLGTIKEADLEAVAAVEPDIIFIGGRLSASYDALSEIAPVVYLATDSELGVVESTSRNAQTIGSIFGLEDKVEELMNSYNDRIQTLKSAYEKQSAIVGMTTSGSFNLLGNDGRCSIIGVEIGFENLTQSESTSTHGNESSFETVVSLNPAYIFVMDRDTAIGSEGSQSAKEILENDLIKTTTAYKNGHIVYLEHPNVWYTAEGGIQALDVMLSDLEQGLK